MTGSYSWTKLSLNSRSEGHGGAGRGAVRTGPALSEVTSVGSVLRNTRKQSQGRGSLVGCRLWGRIESDTTAAT